MAAEARASRINRIFRAAVDEGEVPGVVAIAVNRDKVLYQNAFGVREAGKPAPMLPETVVWYASMTKPLIGTAAMQLVERGMVDLDEPIGRLVPYLAEVKVLEGFDADGKAILRPARRPMTLRHLLTHMSGFSSDIWNAKMRRYMHEYELPSLIHAKRRSLYQPLIADPGEMWEYGLSMDWAAQTVEAISGTNMEDYLIENVFDPLGMKDTRFVMKPEHLARLAKVHQRMPDGSAEPIDVIVSQTPEIFIGGGGLYGTPVDYIPFVQMMLNKGRGPHGGQVLKPETVAEMSRNSVGAVNAGVLNAVMRDSSLDVDFFPGTQGGWGLTFLINPQKGPHGRNPGSLSWAGLANSYFWIDQKAGLAGIVVNQVLPFGDPMTMKRYGEFERAVYREFDGAN